MSTRLNLESLTSVAELKQKRGNRKGWITKAEKHLHDRNDELLEAIDRKIHRRLMANFKQHHLEYVLLQERLIEVLEGTEGVSDATRDKEVSDLETNGERFEELQDDLDELTLMLQHGDKIEKLSQRVNDELDTLEDAPIPFTKSEKEGIKNAGAYLTQLKDLKVELPARWNNRVTTIIKGFSGRMKEVMLKSADPVATTGTSSSATTIDLMAALTKSRLPDLSCPKFKGDKLLWPLFWEQFLAFLAKDSTMSESDRIAYTREAIPCPDAQPDFRGMQGKAGNFDLLVKRLEDRYLDPRYCYKTRVKELVEGKKADLAGAAELARTVETVVSELKASGQYEIEFLLTIIVEMLLTGKLRESWSRHAGGQRRVPNLEDLTKFIRDKGQEQAHIAEDRPKSAPATATQPKVSAKKSLVMYTPADTSGPKSGKSTGKAPCKLCHRERHPMHLCPDFKTMAIPQRETVVKDCHLCRNCLGYGHNAVNCRSRITCAECAQKHHSMLHVSTGIPPPTTAAASGNVSTTQSTATYLANSDPSGGIIPTAIVTIQCGTIVIQARAILDVCSTSSYITSRLVQQLQAATHESELDAYGVGGNHTLRCTKYANITIHTLPDSGYEPTNLQAFVSKSVALMTPVAPLDGVKDRPFLKGLQLADPSFSSPGRIDLLLGLEACGHMDCGRQIPSADRRFHAIATIYGWIVRGWNRADHRQAAVYLNANKAPTDLSQFWEVEDQPNYDQALTKDEDQAVAHFQEHTKRDDNGRYCVRLPMKNPALELGQSSGQARTRFLQNQRSLERKGQWQSFRAIIDEYHHLGHAERVPEADLKKPEHLCYYLPMHGVTKALSTSTKLRAVFDASARTTSGISLNEVLLPGPNQYPLLPEVIMRFRIHIHGMTSDVSKMFREVGLQVEDRDWHRFWWLNEKGQLEPWRMTRVTFGVRSSPFLATQTLLQMAQDYEEKYPRAAELVRKAFYVDDCITGANTLEEAVAIREEINNLLKEGQMTLRKWRTNSEELRKTIPSDLCEEEAVQSLLNPEQCHKTLGVHWDIKRDTMHISTPEIAPHDIITKRQLSSNLAKTYDTLGWFTPALLVAKLMIQQLWKLKLEWDEPAPEEIKERAEQWTAELPALTGHSIPRCYSLKEKTIQSTQLHGFADASKEAYGAVVYLRHFYTDTATSTALVTAKSKVAPTKPLTIPQLELCGAKLLSKVLANAARVLNIHLDQVYAWTDSTIVLAWLRHDPGRLKVFVANRVIVVNQNIHHTKWRHVPTTSNPADMASRGLMPQELVQNDLWGKGPDWLLLEPGQWPEHPDVKTIMLPDVRASTTLLTINPPPVLDTLLNATCLTRLISSLILAKRFISNARKGKGNRNPSKTVSGEEVIEMEKFIVKREQSRHYAQEIEHLKDGGVVPNQSRIRALHPFLDQEQTIRVGGRLEEADLPYNAKHPIIIPRASPLAFLLIKRIHWDNHHVGVSTMIGLLASKYHVQGARRVARKLMRDCLTCRKVHERKMQQIMGQLPPCRVQTSSLFEHVGTDFAGPIIIREGNPRKPRQVKAYICLFVCMAVKAVHIEVVTQLTTEAFLAAMHRFVNRRGLPDTVYSDNGLNYKGASNQLKEVYEFLQSPAANVVHQALAKHHVKWKHTPARAPHFGGMWESNIRRIKELLVKTIKDKSLTFEEINTILIQIEGTLNSRPLVPMESMESDEALALTPGHFIIGRAIKSYPSSSLVHSEHLHIRWNMCQDLVRKFWNEWKETYLRQLIRFGKWHKRYRNVRVGDAVLIKDQNMFVNSWPMGRVTEVHPGKDGQVRTVTVRFKDTEKKRPIVNLALLMSIEEQDRIFSAREDGQAP